MFVVLNFSVKSKLFDKRRKPLTVKNPQIVDRIQSAIHDGGLHHQEKLTIGQLAEAVDEQEYKVRQVINQEMGYRNFVDFINSYRIKEASDILRDKTQAKLTILEIAYKTGFNSIGPFNRAFKQVTGLTPTEFRKKHQ